MLTLVTHSDLLEDFERIRKTDPSAPRQIMALIAELKADKELLDRLSEHEFGADRTEEFHISVWAEQQDQGRNLWRLKSWDLEDQGMQYRIIYSFEPSIERYAILAVAPRSFNYDNDHPITKRIRKVYDNL